jgi:hypothetical protein
MMNLRSYIAIGLILTGAAYSADFFSPFIGPTEYRGQLGFTYVEGENPIISITFELDAMIAGSLIILKVPAGWSHTFSGGTVELIGGSLSPGESLAVPVSLSKYVEPDEYPISSIGITNEGETVQAAGSLVISMMVILRILGAISSIKTTASLGTVGLVFVDILYKRFRRRVDAGKSSEGDLSTDSVLTNEQLDALREELDKSPEKSPLGEGGIKIDPGVGIPSDGHLISVDEKHVVLSPASGGNATIKPLEEGSFSEAAGLEVETLEIDYRDGSESRHLRKFSGIPKHTNLELKRGILKEAAQSPQEESEPEVDGILDRIANFIRNLF